MDKSIETIWKEGFMKDDALAAPKLNDLYKKKSMNIVDQLTRMFKINLVSILAFSAFLLVGSVFVDAFFLGASLALLLAGLVVVGKRELDRLEKIDKGVSSYQYLKAFDDWLKTTLARYARIYRVFYPVFFLTCVLGIWFSRFGELLMAKLVTHRPEIYLVDGVPVYWLLGAVCIAGLLGAFAGAIYKIDMNIVYGRVFNKLEEIIADMEELRK